MLIKNNNSFPVYIVYTDGFCLNVDKFQKVEVNESLISSLPPGVEVISEKKIGGVEVISEPHEIEEGKNILLEG